MRVGSIVIKKISHDVKTDRRTQMRAAAAKVWMSMRPKFRQMGADGIMAFLRADDPAKRRKPSGGR